MARGASSPCAGPTGILNTNLPSFSSCILTWFLHRAPQDIEPDTPTKDSQPGGKSPKANKPPTLDATKTAPKTSEPPSLSGVRSSPGLAPTPDPTTKMTPSPSVAGMPYQTEPTKSPKMTPPSPQSQGLGFSGEAPLGGESTQIPPEVPLQRAS
jgi:hypothetical protein